MLRPRCATQRAVELNLWWDRLIVAGDRWQSEIAGALQHADFGLLCVSHALLASRYVTDVELPALMASNRPIIPVALEPLNLEQLDLKGLQPLQIYHFRPPRNVRGMSFAECGGVNARRFCDELVTQIVQRLDSSEVVI